MKSLRQIYVLAVLSTFTGNVYSAPVEAPQADVIAHLGAAFATHDPARITYAFRSMGDYGTPAAAVVESAVNSMGYELLDNGEIEAAIKVFDLNAETFPSSANAWDSLAEAIMVRGDHRSAIRYYRAALVLDPESNNAAQMIERLQKEKKLSFTSGKKSY
jgi:tetratricopeptide (TPR) repeat protein